MNISYQITLGQLKRLALDYNCQVVIFYNTSYVVFLPLLGGFFHIIFGVILVRCFWIIITFFFVKLLLLLRGYHICE